MIGIWFLRNTPSELDVIYPEAGCPCKLTTHAWVAFYSAKFDSQRERGVIQRTGNENLYLAGQLRTVSILAASMLDAIFYRFNQLGCGSTES